MRKIAFIDRDGTLIHEPEDFQIDAYDKFLFVDHVIGALKTLMDLGFELVMVTNQDGLGTKANPQDKFDMIQDFLLRQLQSQGIHFSAVEICPHLPEDQCACRKPKVGMVMPYMQKGDVDTQNSFVVGDRPTDLALAEQIGLRGFLISSEQSWLDIVEEVQHISRKAQLQRKTNETLIDVRVDLSSKGKRDIHTGIDYFDHMLDQVAKHAGFDLLLSCSGDLNVDEHHTIEDVALALGECLKNALGDKAGIGRFGFSLPMDETQAHVLLDLSARPYCQFKGDFTREFVGDFPTEMVPHFYRSFADSLGASVHVTVEGENAHHMVESSFKALGRALKLAIAQDTQNMNIPSTKGSL